ncbi:MAG: hypothetical protein RIE86_06860 [Imperialibacter sp.]|uniref:golvesin C-terminal-like domain-containing protein n=1 Tax=Imperialibacter sp. TaxID=2038411 RepID=UPI0032EEDAEF
MSAISNILTIARYESKVVWRNWFFRIVSLAGIGFVVIFNLAIFSEIDQPRRFELSNSWMMPYTTMVMISIAQAAAVVFLATGLIKKDKKLDTNEVFFARPISNLDYVLGKALALFNLFFWLNLLLLCIPLVVNLTNPNTAFNPLAFVIYPLLTSLPSVVFTTGIAFLFVTILRNQPITIVLLLGLSAVELIYYFDKFSYILDFMAFRLPMFASEMTGFARLDSALWQRAFYLVAGVAFLFLTAFFLDRLASHKTTKLVTGLVGLLLVGVASFIMLHLLDMRQTPIALRQDMIAVNGQWAEVPNVDILTHHIQLQQVEDKLVSTSTLTVKNNQSEPLTGFYFTLNPGLDISSFTVNDRSVEFERNLQVISAGNTLQPGEEATVQISYQGSIWESVAHLEVDQERYELPNDYLMFALPKKYAYLQSDYVLLTTDVLWYPDTQIGYSREAPRKERTAFIDFQLEVKAKDGQTAVSQGELATEGNVFRFQPEYPLPHISLAIGTYEKKEIIVDSVTYSVYHYPDDDYMSVHLSQLTDTLSLLIRDIVNEYEDGQKMSYPFRRLQFVETPLLFTAYDKVYESQQAYVQPETVYWPEEGGEIREFDFRRQLKDMDEQAKRDNQVLSDKEKQANVFNDLIKKVFTKQSGTVWYYGGRNEDQPDYSLFPHLYSYNSGVVSEDWPLLNRSISSFLRKDQQVENDYSRNMNGISFEEECNELLRTTMINEILTKETDFNKISKSVSLKGQYLFAYLGQLLGQDEFKSFVQNWVNSHQHQLTTYDDFRVALQQRFGLDIDPVIRQVYFSTAQPAFEIDDVQKFEVLDGDRKRYQVLLDIKNTGDNDGVIEVKFNADDGGNDNQFSRRRENQQVKEDVPGYLSVIKVGEAKQLGFVLDEKPDKITINTLISRNIPSVITMSTGIFSPRKLTTLFEGERVLPPTEATSQSEVIVDNEDFGFSTFSPVEPTYLRAYLDSKSPSDQKYFGSWHRSRSKWRATTGSSFYGKSVRSAHFTRSGNGDKLATWEAKLPDEGFYDVYVYMMGKNQNEFNGRDDDNRQFDYDYTIHHSDGTDDIKFNISKAEFGWNYLGSYYFGQNGGKVIVSDKSEFGTVYADAVKWVKQ